MKVLDKAITNAHIVEDVMSTKDSMKNYLASNPRMIGILFTAMLLLSQVGAVAGSGGATMNPGP